MTELRINRLGHKGHGVADGPVFVPMTLPGERVEGTLSGDRLENVRIIEPSADRVKAPCPHFGTCGGCAVQHASDAFVAAWKVEIVKRALSAHDIRTPISGIATSPAQSRRRAAFSGRRTKKGAVVGLHARASGDVIAVPHCKLMMPEVMAAIPTLERLTIAGGSRKGELSLTVTASSAGPDIAVTGGKPLDEAMRIELGQIARDGSVARLVWDGEPIAQDAPPSQTFGGTAVVPPPGAFLQATAHGEAALLAFVRATVGDASRVADLFSGSGTFALPLAKTAEVHAVETETLMLDALHAGWRKARGLKAVTVETRDLFRRPLMPDELSKFGAIVLDPPRAGAVAQTDELAQSDVARIAYVSCNPTSFARDAKRLEEGGYRLTRLVVVDQFRWSAHVELAAAFQRA